LIKEKVKGVLLIGESAPRIQRDLAGSSCMIRCNDMQHAVRYGYNHAQPGDVVLLSPACASFDQYDNYEERGRHFRHLVLALKRKRI
jgi:UDP-N-acetylmuramoylalanine--D-glutamate ligase